MFKMINVLVIFPAVMTSFLLSTKEEQAFREAYVQVCGLQEKVPKHPHAISNVSNKLAQAKELLEFHRESLTEERACEIVQEEEYRKAVNDKLSTKSFVKKIPEARVIEINKEVELEKALGREKFLESRSRCGLGGAALGDLLRTRGEIRTLKEQLPADRFEEIKQKIERDLPSKL